MLPLEHSAILLTCIKWQLVLKTNFLSSFGWLLKTGFTVFSSPPTPSSKREIKFVGAAVSMDTYAKVLMIIKQPMVYCPATFVFRFYILLRRKMIRHLHYYWHTVLIAMRVMSLILVTHFWCTNWWTNWKPDSQSKLKEIYFRFHFSMMIAKIVANKGIVKDWFGFNTMIWKIY